MTGSVLGRAAACIAAAAALAGCTAPAGSSVTVAGKTLTIYTSMPAGGAGGQEAQDVLDAERLALQQNGSKAGTFALRLVTLNGKKVSDDARQAIEDTSAIAYLGEIVPGDSAGSIGITNAQDLLQVSPTDTASALTQATPAVPNSPTLYYESLKAYGRTFARVVPNTALEAKALVSEMRARGARQLYVAGDGSDYGKALSVAVANAAAAAGLSVQRTQSGADTVLYAGTSVPNATRALDAAASANPSVRLFAPSALAGQAFASGLSAPAAAKLEISSPGFLPSALPPSAASQFTGPFRSAFGHAPAPQAIFGYEAMAAVLAVLRQAGSSAGNRSAVVHDFFGLKNRQSVLGTYTIDAAGDTNLGSFVFSRVRGGRLIPFKAVQAQG